MGKTGIWIRIVVVVATALCGCYYLFGPISQAKDTPLMREYSRIHEICSKLRGYSDTHRTFPNGVTTNSSFEGLVAVGAVSADDAAYIRDHQIEYHGFDLSHIAAEVPVFETIFTNTRPPRRLVGFSDGSVTMQNLKQTP